MTLIVVMLFVVMANCWWPCCAPGATTHRLVNATTGDFIFSKDHGDTVRAVAACPSSKYAVAGNRTNAIASTFRTTRQLLSNGNIEWSADHGDTVWALKSLANGDLWSAGTPSSSVTHRRYNSAGVQQQTIDATPFGGGVGVDDTYGDIWAFIDKGGTDPEPIQNPFRYSSDGTIESLANYVVNMVDHDDAGNVYIYCRNSAGTEFRVLKFTDGVSVFDVVVSGYAPNGYGNNAFAVDRDNGEFFVSGDKQIGTDWYAVIQKYDSSGVLAWVNEFFIGFGSSASGRYMAAGGGWLFYTDPAPSSFETGAVYRISSVDASTDGTWDFATGIGTSATTLEISPDRQTLYLRMGSLASQTIRAYDADTPSTLIWSQSALSNTNGLSANGTQLGQATTGGLYVRNASDGSVIWSDTTASFLDVSINGDVYGLTTSTASTDSLLRVYNSTGTLQYCRKPKIASGTGNSRLSSNGSEIVIGFSGVYGAKLFDSDGVLFDCWGTTVLSVAFDEGFTYIGTAADIIKINSDTMIRSWRAAFGTVDLAISSTNKVLSGTGVTLRQLTSAGASDWTKSVGGTIAAVAYDASDNVWVVHSRSSSITHRKYGPTGTALLTGDHGGNLNAVECDASSQPIIGGVRV